MRKDFKKNVVSVLSVLSIGCAACGAYVLSAEVNDTLATAAIEQTQTVELKGDFVMKSGASVRKEDPKGIRFSTYVKESVYSENNAYGTLIIPAAILGEQALTEEVTSAVDVKANVWADSDVDGYKLYHSVLTKIPESYYGVELVARSYVVVDGEYEFVDEAQVRSIAQVAASALVAGEDDSAKVLENYVDKAVKSFTLDITEKQSLKAGDTLTLTATAQPSYAMLWNSSNEKVATVKDGVVTAVGEGTATISVKLGSKVLSCEVEVGARQFANVGKVSVSEENGALVWAKVAATDNAEFFADSYAVTLTNEKGEVSTCQVSENAYLPYTLAEGVYTITVKATDSKGYVASSENSSEEYKFVVARHADYLAADMPEEFTSSENGTNVKYDEESGYAVIRNEREYGLITTKKGISLNMAINPIIVMVLPSFWSFWFNGETISFSLFK